MMTNELTNDFATIDAQDQTSRMAQLSPEEVTEANSYYDELNAAMDEQGLFTPTPETEARYQEKLTLLASIHEEINSQISEMRHKDELLEAL